VEIILRGAENSPGFKVGIINSSLLVQDYCPRCQVAEAFLDAHRIPYKLASASDPDDDNAISLMADAMSEGIMSTPIWFIYAYKLNYIVSNFNLYSDGEAIVAEGDIILQEEVMDDGLS
jgi:hypothetical protein